MSRPEMSRQYYQSRCATRFKRGLPVNGAGGLCVGLRLVYVVVCACGVWAFRGAWRGLSGGVRAPHWPGVCGQHRKQANAHGASPQRRKEPWAR